MLISKTKLSKVTNDLLLSHQKKHVVKNINNICTKRIALDFSDTGTGKTSSSLAICKELNLRPYIISPKSAIYIWYSWCKKFGIKPYDIVNYETLRTGQNYISNLFRGRKKCSYLYKLDDEYKWSNLEKNSIVIFDEFHICNGRNTLNNKLLISLKQLINQNIPILLLSATSSTRIRELKSLYYLLDFIKYEMTEKEFKWFIRNYKPNIDSYVSRMSINDIGTSHTWYCNEYFLDDHDLIYKAYSEIDKLSKEYESNPDINILAKIVRLKQFIEIKKIPLFIEETNNFIRNNYSVVIFVNYIKTIKILKEKLKCICIYGKISQEERNNNIDLFQKNKERIIICQAKTGISISLHDTHGSYPRVSLLNNIDDAKVLIQCMGRTNRAEAKSHILQIIVLIADIKYERKIAKNLNKRLKHLGKVNKNNYDYEIFQK